MTIPLSSFAFLAAARALVGLGTLNDISDPLVDTMLLDAGLPLHAPWDLAFVHHVGWQTHREPGARRSSWPFRRTATRGELAAVARSRRLVATRPRAGDIALIWSPEDHAYFGTAIVTRLEFVEVGADGHAVYECRTIEGDAAYDGDVGRSCVRETERSLCPARGDMLVRWDRLDRRRQLGDPVVAALAGNRWG